MEEDKEKTKNKKVIHKKRVKKENIVEVKRIEEVNEEANKKEENTLPNKGGKSLFNLAEVIVIMIITALFGALIGAVVTYVRSDSAQKYTVKNDKNLAEFSNVYNDILGNYYMEVDKDGLIDSAIKGMVDFLGDPYSEYFDESSAKDFDERLEGEFVGMGAEITVNQDGKVVVAKIFDNSPALTAGIKAGDIINKVDNKDLTGLTVDQVASLIKAGKAGTKVMINVIRNGESIDIEVTRGKVEIDTAVGSIIEVGSKKVGLIKISSFSKNTAIQFKAEYDRIKAEKIDSLIVDVRDNFGGYLSVAKDIADYFLDKDDIVYQTNTKGSVEKTLSNTAKSIDLPLVVLTNGASASASEILTAALKENLNIDVVGTKTYGKGTVQKLYKLSDGTSLKYTIQNWLTPKGNAIDKVGITPTVIVELNQEYYANPTNDNDNQLQKALELLTK